MVFHGKEPIRSKIVLDGNPIEQVSESEYLGTDLSYRGEVDVGKEIINLRPNKPNTTG